MKRGAVLGSPIAGALSPVLHRAAYAALGLDWQYDAIECSVGELATFLGAVRADDGWAGLSLTMPLKRAAVDLLDEVSEVVEATGTANTVIVRAGRLVGDNTDVIGMRYALRDVLTGVPADAAVLGAGATAATALSVLNDFGCRSVLVVVRNVSRTSDLAAAADRLGIGIDIVNWGRADEAFRRGLVISAIPPHAADNLAAVAARHFVGTLLDVVYRPSPSKLVAAARAAGATAIDGLPMLVHQAARQVVLQTEHVSPTYQHMWKAATDALR